jgi:hypothetical protein
VNEKIGRKEEIFEMKDRSAAGGDGRRRNTGSSVEST